MSATAVRPDRIHTMRTYFRTSDDDGAHEVDPPTFAESVLRAQRQRIERLMADLGGIEPVDAAQILRVRLGDPARPIGGARAVTAYVNAGNWLARCECGGAEFIDFAVPIFMCCSCWNEEDGHAWRAVVCPTAATRRAAEEALLARPDRLTRNFRPDRGEKVADLRRENSERGIGAKAVRG